MELSMEPWQIVIWTWQEIHKSTSGLGPLCHITDEQQSIRERGEGFLADTP